VSFDWLQATNASNEHIEGPSPEMTEAFRLEFDWIRGQGDEPQHRITIYFKLRQNIFALNLMYNKADPKGPRYEQVFMETARSISTAGVSK
jgi:hypothetical protein